ncbi:long-chain fatty acid--CoA ligase [Frankia sp. CcI49]|uniref:AMP-dependent synthetase/ligase n=1 Tax=unclassified Frankia TaxID=2632575 RepID=UPI0006CA4657|nr:MULTISPECIES: AMP-binding protein [unclassified Frankia]KPM50724.1 AMP-dependent synthetase [Frankia sp. R43]ONH54123.1 long-chain fatty acid--CoA ligase [Frankia sp. CcI49]
MTDIALQRAAIDAEIEGLTLVGVLERTVRERGTEPAYSDRRLADGADDGRGWRTVTWAELVDRARELAAGFLDAGLAPGEAVAIMASNRIEHVVADIATVLAGGIPVSVYNTLSPEQVGYVAGHVEPRIVVLETADHAARWSAVLAEKSTVSQVIAFGTAFDALTASADADADAAAAAAAAGSVAVAVAADVRVVTWDQAAADGARALAHRDAELAIRGEAIKPDDPITILYTSGTTGRPKGVVLTHRNIWFEAAVSARKAHLDGPGISVSYLPFAHIAERILGLYIPQLQGGHVHLIDDPAALAPALAEIRPTRFFGVPRVWEKIRAGIGAKLAAEPNAAKREAVAQALAIGQAYVESTQTGRTTPPELRARFEAVDGPILRPLRAALGLDRIEWASSAAAPMPVEIARFLAGLGLSVYDVYGMTETTASATAGGPDAFRLGTVGTAQDGIEVRIADDGEILVRGPITTPGYHREPTATAELIDPDGWVHTGDVGELDEDGFLRVVDRKKDIIITSSGKNIAPSNIENALKESPLIGQALVIGEGRPYLVAILTLDGETAPIIARRLGVEGTTVAELAVDPAILDAVAAVVAATNARLSRPEQIKAYELLTEEWTIGGEQLTPTLKLKRKVVISRYEDVIADLYQRGRMA